MGRETIPKYKIGYTSPPDVKYYSISYIIIEKLGLQYLLNSLRYTFYIFEVYLFCERGNAVFNGRFHLYTGILTWLFFALNGTYFHPILLLAVLWPDCDIRGPLISYVCPLWLVFKHRGPTHTIWGLGITSGIVCITLGNWAALSWAIGYFVHLLFDSMTPMGVNWIKGK